MAEEVMTEQQPIEAKAEQDFVEDTICKSEAMRKLFVGGLEANTTDEDFKAYFEKVSGGKVSENFIVRRQAKDKKGLVGFVTLETSNHVDELLLKRSELNFNGRMLEVKRAVPKDSAAPGAHETTTKLFIANLPKTNCTEADVRAYFEARHPKKYGEIKEIQLLKKKDGTDELLGYGFVIVSSEDMADKMAIQHATFKFGGRKIELKKSVPTNPEGNRGRGRGRGGRGGPGRGGPPRGRGGRGGGNYQQYGGNYGGQADYTGYGGYGDNSANYGNYGGYGYDGYSGGYDEYGYPLPSYGAGYSNQQTPRGGATGGRGGRGGQQRFNPY